MKADSSIGVPPSPTAGPGEGTGSASPPLPKLQRDDDCNSLHASNVAAAVDAFMQPGVDVCTVLHRHLIGPDAIANIKRVAFAMKRAERTLYAWAEGANQIRGDDLVLLMRLIPGVARDLLAPTLQVVEVPGGASFDGLHTSRIISEAQAELAIAMEDGVVDDEERPRVHNRLVRLVNRTFLDVRVLGGGA